MAVIILSLSVNIILIVTLRKAIGDRRGPYQTNDVSARFQNDPADRVNYAALSFTSNQSQSRKTQEVQTKVLYAALRPQPTAGVSSEETHMDMFKPTTQDLRRTLDAPNPCYPC
ncbi:hypothetical protein GN956_G26473 [Arapaima gigas]